MTPHEPKLPVPTEEMEAKSDAFDVWLNRGLHELYDNIAQEPIPPELLKLIEDSRPK